MSDSEWKQPAASILQIYHNLHAAKYEFQRWADRLSNAEWVDRFSKAGTACTVRAADMAIETNGTTLFRACSSLADTAKFYGIEVDIVRVSHLCSPTVIEWLRQYFSPRGVPVLVIEAKELSQCA